MMDVMVVQNHPSSAHFRNAQQSNPEVGFIPELGTQVALPALDSLYSALYSVEGRHISNKVPTNHGAMQVGFRGTPEGFEGMDVAVRGDGLRVITEHPKKLEGPYLESDEVTGEKRIGRVVLGPIASIDVERTENPGVWNVIPRDEEGEPIRVPEGGRVMLARTLAKLADVSQGKISRPERVA